MCPRLWYRCAAAYRQPHSLHWTRQQTLRQIRGPESQDNMHPVQRQRCEGVAWVKHHQVRATHLTHPTHPLLRGLGHTPSCHVAVLLRPTGVCLTPPPALWQQCLSCPTHTAGFTTTPPLLHAICKVQPLLAMQAIQQRGTEEQRDGAAHQRSRAACE